SQPTIPLTFEREAALDDRSLAFITPVHPLTQAAARGLAGDDELRVSLAVSSSDHPAGTYVFAIYRWRFLGLKEDAILVPIIEHQGLMHDFMALLRRARDIPAN